MSLDLMSGLVQGFSQSYQQKEQRQLADELKKFQVKIFKQQLDQQEKKQSALDQITQALMPVLQAQQVPQFGEMGEQYAPMEQQVMSQPPKPQEFFASPKGFGLGMQAGLPIDDLSNIARGRPGENLMNAIIQQYFPQAAQGMSAAPAQSGTAQGGMGTTQGSQSATPQGGMSTPQGQRGGFGGDFVPSVELDSTGKTVIKLNPNRPKFKDEYPSADGQWMIQRNEFGQEIGRRPITPGEVKPAPITPQTKGQDAIDQAFGKEYVDFKASGGFADIDKQLDQLRHVSSRLEKENLTGPFVGTIPDASLPYLNPDAQAAQDAVEEVVQRNLRLVLGAQFTEKEGERLIARAYNRKLSGTENKKRVDRLIKQIETAAKAKQEAAEYFEENGTLKGFKGKLWTMADFMQDKTQGSQKPSVKDMNSKGKVIDFSELPP